VKRSRFLAFCSVAAVALSCVAALPIVVNAASEAVDDAPPLPATRRLTPAQYRNVIADVFGPTILLGGRFDLDMRVDGLMEVGASQVSISPAGMEQYDIMARAIADQVVDPKHRDLLVPCAPVAADKRDDACAAAFLTQAGRLLYRRPLTDEERDLQVAAAGKAADTVHDFHEGLSLSLASMLASPQFLFRQENVVPERGTRGKYTLDAYSKAGRLSFFLWNSVPDLQLLAAAEKGDLATKRGLTKQVERMLASPRMEAGVRAFFSDMLHFELVDSLTKDTVIYPKFSSQVALDAREQTLRTLVQLLLVERGDYRDVFTSKKTFLTQELASIYKVPLVSDVYNGAVDAWTPFEFPADDPRAGLLMQVSFVTLHSHPGRSSPTLRGKALREILLCQKVPAPPGDVEFTIVQDTSNPTYRTARQRLEAHATNPVCTGCHKITDPMGLALENFDGGGNYRTTENGVALDTSGVLDGVKFTNGAELGRAVAQNPAATSCVVDRISSYALGRKPVKSEDVWIAALKQDFAKGGYVVPDLMREIALSPEFYRASPLPRGDVKTTWLDQSRTEVHQ
jgi:hypothetical protein